MVTVTRKKQPAPPPPPDTILIELSQQQAAGLLFVLDNAICSALLHQLDLAELDIKLDKLKLRLEGGRPRLQSIARRYGD